jgi:hypothetical protein
MSIPKPKLPQGHGKQKIQKMKKLLMLASLILCLMSCGKGETYNLNTQREVRFDTSGNAYYTVQIDSGGRDWYATTDDPGWCSFKNDIFSYNDDECRYYEGYAGEPLTIYVNANSSPNSRTATIKVYTNNNQTTSISVWQTGKTPTNGGGNNTLSAPTNFRATALSSSSIQLSWDAVPNAAGYGIYFTKGNSTQEELVAVGPIQELTWIHSSQGSIPLSPNTLYNYSIYAYRSTNQSARSYASATTLSNNGGNGNNGGNSPQPYYVGGTITITTLSLFFNFNPKPSRIKVEAYNPSTGRWVVLNQNISGSATSYAISPYRDYVTTPVQYGFAKVRVSGYNGSQWSTPKVVVFDIGWGEVYEE